ncbi:zinc transporter ZupT [Weeksella virosa]|uniref:zinc transporter ZupT n=1 Tax=Weeksella virosa TaxID=1014 RepID=UPI002555633B|nr:zinc transporter ZupT [Weeksella virosa]MDK7675646.1 zinc transporter ZupT [Weeksella virosa]
MEENVLFALALTLIAGLCTGIGSLLSVVYQRFNPKFLCLALAFSAGVMIYVSFVEILGKARSSLMSLYDVKTASIYTTLGFFAGIAFIAALDRFLPESRLPQNNGKENENDKLMRMGLFAALALGLHNFPEGLATFMGAIADPAYGVGITVAIAIHNIPEGIAVAVPIFYATKSRKKAFTYSFLSGLAEPAGALVGYFILKNLMDDYFFGLIFSSVAGIMVYISLSELIPTANEYGNQRLTLWGIIGGMLLMASSLILLM